VTVRADKFALGDFGQYQSTVVATHQAHVIELVKAWQMIPGHRGMVERIPAIYARHF
jgi:hypothetical protein